MTLLTESGESTALKPWDAEVFVNGNDDSCGEGNECGEENGSREFHYENVRLWINR